MHSPFHWRRNRLRWIAATLGAILALAVLPGLTSTANTAVNPGADVVRSPSNDGGQAGDGSVADPNLQYYGRWAPDGSWRTMGWAGGYVEAAFTGSTIGVRLRNAIDVYYSVDGAPEQWRRSVSGNVTIASGLGGGTHTIRIGFRERAGSYTGDPAFGGFNLASGGSTTSIARPANFIEFIGDSITVGQPNGNRPFTAYPYLVGEALGAGHIQVAQGGACLVSTSDGCYGMMDWFRRSSA